MPWYTGEAAHGGVPRGQRGCGGEEQRHGELLGEVAERAAACSRGQMHQPEIKQREHAQHAVGCNQRARHTRDQYSQRYGYRNRRSEEPAAVALMKSMPLLERGVE